MSLPEKDDGNKITPVDNSETSVDGSEGCRAKSKPTSSQSDGNILTQESHGAIPKVCKAVSLSNNITEKPNDNSKVNDLVCTMMEGLILSPESSEENICRSDWLKARDSLENLLYTKPDKANAEVNSSKSTSCTAPKEKFSIGESPHSESVIGGTKTSCANSVSKVLAWDPWDKLSRKHKKENKRRKFDSTHSKEDNSTGSQHDQNRKDFKSGDEVRSPSETVTTGEDETLVENYEYQPYQGRNERSVEFTNRVMVVYIKEDKVVEETTEPLKKELEQQIRNKEMRKGHMPDIAFGKRRMVSDWFKK